MFDVETIVLGLFFGSIYALSASGIVLTYTATGVFNLAHFAIGLLAAYLAWELNGVHGVPLVPTVLIVLFVFAPVLGLLLEAGIFRPLQARRAGSSEKLVAALGLTVVVLAVIDIAWGPGVQGTNLEPVPRLFPERLIEIGSVSFSSAQAYTAVVVIVVSAALYWLLHRTFLGTSIRAVVDRRELAELAAIDSHRVAQAAWILGCGLAALTGMLLASEASVLEPQRIIFFGIETFSVAVLARLVSLPRAVLYGFVLGVAKAILATFAPFGNDGGVAEVYAAIVLNLSSVVLFVALIAYRRLDEVGEGGTTAQGLVFGAFGRARRVRVSGPVAVIAVAVAFMLLPSVLDDADLFHAQRMIALAVIFVSIVCITGFSGHLTLGQASIAGLGAFATARFANAFDMPVLVAMLCGSAVALVAGLLAGYPALRRKGLFLGLTTLALALVIDRFVFNAELLQGGAGGLTVERPTFFGIDLSGDVAFYFYELVVLGLVLFLARNLRSGRIGRVLAAMRDSDTAASSIGIGLRRAKLFVFAVSSAMAGLGGALLVQTDRNWDVNTFNPVFGLFWFTVVVVCGVSTIGGALLGAFLYVVIPRTLPGFEDINSAMFIFGVGAILLGRLPGGVVRQVSRLPRAIAARLGQEYRSASDSAADVAPAPLASPFARKVLTEQDR